MQAVAVLVPEPSALHAELHELAGVLDREETKEDLVEERENRSVGGDAEARDSTAATVKPGVARTRRTP